MLWACCCTGAVGITVRSCNTVLFIKNDVGPGIRKLLNKLSLGVCRTMLEAGGGDVNVAFSSSPPSLPTEDASNALEMIGSMFAPFSLVLPGETMTKSLGTGTRASLDPSPVGNPEEISGVVNSIFSKATTQKENAFVRVSTTIQAGRLDIGTGAKVGKNFHNNS